MGKPMARNLMKAGHSLVVHNRSQAPVAELVKEGAQKADSPKEVAARTEIVITMLPDSPDVEEVVLGENGVLKGIKPGSVIIDMSSISALTAKKVAVEAKRRGVEMLDAPVSGGEPAAIQGTLSIMVGGNQATYNKCLDVLKMMGKSIVRVGDNGAGQTAKLANQIIVAANIATLGEAFVLGRKAGLDPKVLYEALKNGLAGSNVMNAKVPMILERNFRPGFRIELHYKDLKNALETARELSVPLPLTSLLQQVLCALINDERGGYDHSAIVSFFEDIGKIEIKRFEAEKDSY
jgi:2-hydroxy-3-oxopropionate reductase